VLAGGHITIPSREELLNAVVPQQLALEGILLAGLATSPDSRFPRMRMRILILASWIPHRRPGSATLSKWPSWTPRTKSRAVIPTLMMETGGYVD
jgi:hypothetical protein